MAEIDAKMESGQWGTMRSEGEVSAAIAARFRSSDLILVGEGEFARSIDLLAQSAATPPRRLWIGKNPDPAAPTQSLIVHITNTEHLIDTIGRGDRTRVFFAARMSQSTLFKGDRAAAAASMSSGDFTNIGRLRALGDHLELAGYVPSKFADVFPELCLRAGECMGPPCDLGVHQTAAANCNLTLREAQSTVALLGISGNLLHRSGRAMTADDYFESNRAKKTTDAKLAYIKNRTSPCPLDEEVITPGLIAKIATLVKVAIVDPGMVVFDRASVLKACSDHSLSLCAAQET